MDLYEGRRSKAHEAADGRRGRGFGRSPLMFTEGIRVEAILMRGRCALALAEALPAERRGAPLCERRARAPKKLARVDLGLDGDADVRGRGGRA